MAADPDWLAWLAQAGPVDLAALFERAACGTSAYYEREAVLGAAGDFVTAPEISQAFGELIGLALAEAWTRAGAPAPFVLAELGPGSGQLMADLWRAVDVLPGFSRAAAVHLVERSERLRARQRRALEGAVAVTFLETVEALPQAPLFLVANEFLDALPVHQLVRRAGGWRERRIALVDGRMPGWSEGPAPVALAEAAAARYAAVQEGAIAEVAPARAALVRAVAERIAAHGGLALLIDYGGMPSAPVDTLQAVRRHRQVSPLDHLGEADLTTAVDFAPLVDAAETAGAAAHGPLPQATFLRALGIELRAMALARPLRGEARDAVLAGVHRLLDPRTMGEAFKVLAVTPRAAAPPPGFEGAAPLGTPRP